MNSVWPKNDGIMEKRELEFVCAMVDFDTKNVEKLHISRVELLIILLH